MSEDGFSDGFDEPTMEIQIKTLMGTTFDIKVSPADTIEDIKKKIYRVEGIPVYQQNLIFRSKELKDSKRLCDAGIVDGTTLTLVTSMRGGPISTRRLSVTCEHHVMLKELKELLENTRDEIGEKLAPGSKVSVLVFKEGDIINLLRVIENEDGSYSPYSEKPISPPGKPPRGETDMGVFERVVEDKGMSTKIANLRKKMSDLSLRRQMRNSKPPEDKFFSEASSSLPFKFLTDCDLLDVDLRIFERSLEEGNQSETEEIALKDKHRTKPGRLSKSKSVYSESKGNSSTKEVFTRIHKKKREVNASRERIRNPEDILNSSILAPICGRERLGSKEKEETEEELTLPQELPLPCTESLSVSTRNRVHLTRLVLSDGPERPKSSPDSIELEEKVQDMWEIHESASERLKHSATCNVGLLKRRQSLDYGYEGIENSSNGKPELGEYNYCKNSEFEVCSGNYYHHHLPQFVSSPSAIPPQYTPKDYYFRNNSRSPLYGRKTKNDDEFDKPVLRLPEIKNDKFGFLSECSNIQRLKNDCAESKNLSDTSIEQDELIGYSNLACSSTELFGEGILGGVRLPPVMKKKMRCSECNRRLNITNIYDCRCGRIFCSQHRYPEVHECTYDYKTQGRRILEQQNPLVTAEKVARI